MPARPHLSATVLAVALAAGGALPAAEGGARSILFIGNSLTFTNDLPAMLARFAAEGGQGGLEVGRALAGGWTLARHWDEGPARALLAQRPWTWVVLQEHSRRPLEDPAGFAADARRWIAAVRASGARPVLYQTWAVLGALDAQPRLSAAYRALADGDALLVPAGDAFLAYRREHGDGSLFSDNRHPVERGTYLAAASFYATLFAADPAALSWAPPGLDPALAADLRRRARPAL